MLISNSAGFLIKYYNVGKFVDSILEGIKSVVIFFVFLTVLCQQIDMEHYIRDQHCSELCISRGGENEPKIN